jgi:LPPG:FO 2-phospho-L-lactate transferase
MSAQHSSKSIDNPASHVVALCGGVGGAKLANGLYRVLAPDTLSVGINSGDDFEHLGLRISPDIDTVTYTLAGINNTEAGWGRKDETWNFMDALGELGGETWFSLGDKDLATNIERTRRLQAGENLSAITADFSRSLGIAANLLPMSDDKVRTRVLTKDGYLDFQDYFVRRQCQPVVREIIFKGAEKALPCKGLLAVLQQQNLRAVIICPSNPYLSIDPILSVPGIREALSQCSAPVIAVSPLVGGRAVKGPTTKIMAELSLPLTARTISDHYAGLIDAIVIDKTDQVEVEELSIQTMVTQTLMKSTSDQEKLANDVLSFSDSLCNEDYLLRRSI